MFKFLILVLAFSFSFYAQAEDIGELSDDSSEIESLLDDLEGDRLLEESDESGGDLAFQDDDSIDDEIKKKKKRTSKKTRKRTRVRQGSYRKNKLIPSELNNPDKRFSRKTRKIKHPLSKKGLYRITKDLDYLYKTNTPKTSKAASVRFGNFEPTKLRNINSNRSFAELYEDASGLIILFDYEWKKFLFSTFDLKLGTGLFFASGNGQFASQTNQAAGLIPQEKFTFIMAPNNISLGYKFKVFDKQWLIPFVDSGVDIFSIIETSEVGTKIGGSYGGHFAAGAALSLKSFDRVASSIMSDEYGISDMWLKVEYRQYLMFAGDFDFSGNTINAGLEFDF